MKKTIARLGLAAAIAASAMATQVQAYKAGDIIVRAGITSVNPETDSSNISIAGAAQAGSGVDVDSDVQLGLTVEYMLSSNWGIELLAATPFSHDVTATGSLSSVGKVAEIKHLPPTLSAVYHFTNSSSITPYLGAGINYTIFFDEEGKGAFEGSRVELDNSFGFAAQVGADMELSDNLMLNASIRYIDIDTDAKLSGLGGTSVEVEVDPFVYSIMLGYKF